MKLVPVVEEDLQLYLDMFCNPEYMKFLGGPQTHEQAKNILDKQIKYAEKGDGFTFKIVPEKKEFLELLEDTSYKFDQDYYSPGVGTICIWNEYPEGKTFTQIGYGVLPKFQKQGFAKMAIGLLLEMIKKDKKWEDIHVYTDIENKNSLLLCKSLGFEKLKEEIVEYNNHKFTSAHFVLPIPRESKN